MKLEKKLKNFDEKVWQKSTPKTIINPQFNLVETDFRRRGLKYIVVIKLVFDALWFLGSFWCLKVIHMQNIPVGTTII